jgi:bacterial/archaeal transporter family-2 protein
MTGALVVVALLAGAVLPMQAAINAQLRYVVGSPVLAALVSFTVGTLSLLAYALMVRTPLPDSRLIAQAPWWVWSGGLLGAAYVFAAVVVTPRLGVAALLGLALVGQSIAALIMDHYGLLGLTVRPLSGARVAGVLCLAAGVILISRR